MKIAGTTGTVWARNITKNTPLTQIFNGSIDAAEHGLIGFMTSWNHKTEFDNLKVIRDQGPICEGDNDPAPELCDDLDNDCDNIEDDDYLAGGPVSYTDLDGTTGLRKGDPCGVGACAGGTVVCAGDETTLTCSTANLAHAEVCDGIDNDCDGKLDAADAADLLANDLQNCEKQSGVCGGSTKPASLCQGGNWSTCGTLVYTDHNPKYEAGTEIRCDGLDNDCDASVDEDFTMTQLNGATVTGIGKACGVGECGGGVTVCTPNDLGIYCPTESNSSPEVCDSKDNDCDGKTDHSGGDGADLLVHDLQNCENQNGVCGGSTKPSFLCVSGNWQACTDTQYANHSSNYESGTETKCDGLDNECDNDIDDDFSVTLMDGSTVVSGGIGESCGFGSCSGGVTECNGAGTGVVCSTEFNGSSPQVANEVCDGVDNDCDNRTDHTGGDGADLLVHDLQNCENQNGVCGGSTKPSSLCVSGNWQACTDTQYANHSSDYESGTETCDGLDNECDNDIDDDFPSL